MPQIKWGRSVYLSMDDSRSGKLDFIPEEYFVLLVEKKEKQHIVSKQVMITDMPFRTDG